MSATPPSNVTGLPARVGFLAVDVDLGDVRLDAVGGPAASLRRLGGATGPLSLGSLLTDQGTLTPGSSGCSPT